MFSPLSVQIPQQLQQYTVQFCHDFTSLWGAMQRIIGTQKCLFVTDENVARVDSIWQHVPAERQLVLPAGESTKSWPHLQRVIDTGLSLGLDRNSVLVAVGGGVVGDVTGLAASLMLRGIDCLQVPTSLLAMVDASIGGKTAINTPQGKNLIGTFHQPCGVLVCEAWLNSLPQCEVQCGQAEMLKHGIVSDAVHFAAVAALRPDAPIPLSLIRDSIQIKQRIVQADVHETGLRAHLNLGHTFGHAIEQLSNYAIAHGQAVAIGLVLAAQYAQTKNLCDAQTVQQITNAVAGLGLPTQCDYDTHTLWAAMAHDKKRIEDTLHLILPTSIGTVVQHAVPPLGIIKQPRKHNV